MGIKISIIFTTGKVSPSEYKYPFQFSMTTMASENIKENIVQNSDLKNALPK